MKKDDRTKVEGKGEVTMSLYEINQSIISQLPSYDDDKIADLQNRLCEWEKQSSNKYFMLLCNDLHYCTVLNCSSVLNCDFINIGEAVTSLIREMNYTIHSDENATDHFEIWGKNEEGTFCFLLFPYDMGVVTYGR